MTLDIHSAATRRSGSLWFMSVDCCHSAPPQTALQLPIRWHGRQLRAETLSSLPTRSAFQSAPDRKAVVRSHREQEVPDIESDSCVAARPAMSTGRYWRSTAVSMHRASACRPCVARADRNVTHLSIKPLSPRAVDPLISEIRRQPGNAATDASWLASATPPPWPKESP